MYSLKTGLGDQQARFQVFMGNRPDYEFAPCKDGFSALKEGDIYSIGLACGNGWRKVFNVYAKLVYALPCSIAPIKMPYHSWQDYRDKELLQNNSNTALFFAASNQDLQDSIAKDAITIIMGKTYAKTLFLPNTLNWINDKFGIDSKHKVIVCPYFDYRQLSNSGILFLVDIIKQIGAHSGSIFAASHIE